MIDVQELDKSEEVHKSWWNALLYVCEEELREAEARRQDDKARLKKDMGNDTWRGRDVGIHASLDSSVQEHLSGNILIRQHLSDPICHTPKH